jgi:hypothetical protein
VFEQVAEVVGACYEIDYFERFWILECFSKVLKKRLRFLLQVKCEFRGPLGKGLTRNLLMATATTLSVVLSMAMTLTPSLAAVREIRVSSAKASSSSGTPRKRHIVPLVKTVFFVTSQAPSRYFEVSCWY